MTQQRNQPSGGGSSQGPSVDTARTPVIDPTKNVQDILNAAVKRLDDLRKESVLARNIGLKYLRELIDLRAEYTQKLMDQQAEYTEKLRLAESRRIDAIRSVDVNAVSVASERAAAAATVLANQVQASAETLRALVATTAATQAQAATATATQLSERIASLEKGAYEGIGKGRVIDPQLTEAIAQMNRVGAFLSEKAGGTRSQSVIISYIFATAGVLVAVGSLIFAITK